MGTGKVDVVNWQMSHESSRSYVKCIMPELFRVCVLCG